MDSFCKGKYLKLKKELQLDIPKFETVPSYAYYVCEAFEERHGVEVKYISFKFNKTERFKKDDLRGVYDWSDLKCIK